MIEFILQHKNDNQGLLFEKSTLQVIKNFNYLQVYLPTNIRVFEL